MVWRKQLRLKRKVYDLRVLGFKTEILLVWRDSEHLYNQHKIICCVTFEVRTESQSFAPSQWIWSSCAECRLSPDQTDTVSLKSDTTRRCNETWETNETQSSVKSHSPNMRRSDEPTCRKSSVPVDETVVVGRVGSSDAQTHYVFNTDLHAGISRFVRLIEEQRLIHCTPELLEVWHQEDHKTFSHICVPIKNLFDKSASEQVKRSVLLNLSPSRVFLDSVPLCTELDL